MNNKAPELRRAAYNRVSLATVAAQTAPEEFHRVTGTSKGLLIEVDGVTYRCVTWFGAAHYQDRVTRQVWMTHADYLRNEWRRLE